MNTYDDSLDTRHESKITLETVLWVLVALTALVLRLANLDAAPLNAGEARQAMLAWQAMNGQPAPAAGYSPFLLAADALIFALCGAGDALARLWPALFGAALALTPLLLSRHLGQVGVLAAGLILAISPTALFASRQVDGTVVAATGAMVCLGGLLRFLEPIDPDVEKHRRGWLWLAAGGLALALVSNPSAYGLILPMGLGALITAWAWGGLEEAWERLRPHLPSALAVFLAAGLALATGLWWNPAGLGAAGDLLASWVGRFRPVPAPAPFPLTVLFVYEPLALLFGVLGLIATIRQDVRIGRLAGLWAVLSLLLLVLMPGRAAFDMLWLVLPLALLAGLGLRWLAQSLRDRGAWLSEGLYVPVVVILWVHEYLMLARYAELDDPAHLALAFLTLALQVLLAMIFGLAIGVETALRGLGAGTAIAFLAATLAAGWGGAHERPADPRELLVREPTAVEVRDLVRTLQDRSWRRTGIPTTLPLAVEAAPDSVLAWYLRDFTAARRVDSFAQEEETALPDVLVNAPPDLSAPGLPAALDGSVYVGQDFALRRRWDPALVACTREWPPRCGAAVRWLLFRDTAQPPVVDQWAVMWVRDESRAAGE
jgi:uncharacterized protein (TIGR03663 family)